MNVVMVVDTVNGRGHVSRSTALREAMPPGWSVAVADASASAMVIRTINPRIGPNLVIVDDYRVDASLIAHWHDRCTVVVFDDGQFGHSLPGDAHLIRAHGAANKLLTRITEGHDYCPIRKMGEVPAIDDVVVVVGGVLSTSTVAKVVDKQAVTPVWPSRPRMVICGGGQTCLEAAHLGVPSVIVTVADNQNANARGLQDAGLARWFGTWEEATANPGALAECVREQLDNEAWRKHVAVEGPKWIDGKGGARVVEHIRRLVER